MAALPPPGVRDRRRPGTRHRSPAKRRDASGQRCPGAPPDAAERRPPVHPAGAVPRPSGHRTPEAPSDAAEHRSPGRWSDAGVYRPPDRPSYARPRRTRRTPRDAGEHRSTRAPPEALRRPPPEDPRDAPGYRPTEGQPGVVGCLPSGRPAGAVARRRTETGPGGVAAGRSSGVTWGVAGRSGRGTSACAGSTRCPSPARRWRWSGSRRATVRAVRGRPRRTCPRSCRPTARTGCPGARPAALRRHAARPTTAPVPPPREGGAAGRSVATRNPRAAATGPHRTTAGTARSARSPGRQAPGACPGSGPRPVVAAGMRWRRPGAAGPVGAGRWDGGAGRCVRRTSNGSRPGPPHPARPAPPHRPDSSGHHDSAARRAVPAAGPARWPRPHQWIRPAAATGSSGSAGRRTRAGPPGGTRRPGPGHRRGRSGRCPAGPIGRTRGRCAVRRSGRSRRCPARSRRPPAQAPRGAPSGCGRARGVLGSGRAALRRSCAPRFLVPGPLLVRAVVLPGAKSSAPGTHTRTRGCASRRGSGDRAVPPFVRVTLRVVRARTATSPRARGICPDRPPTLR